MTNPKKMTEGANRAVYDNDASINQQADLIMTKIFGHFFNFNERLGESIITRENLAQAIYNTTLRDENDQTLNLLFELYYAPGQGYLTESQLI